MSGAGDSKGEYKKPSGAAVVPVSSVIPAASSVIPAKAGISPLSLETAQEHIRGNTLTALVVSQVIVKEAKGDEKQDSKLMGELKGHSSSVYALAELSDGRLASGSMDSTIKLWNVRSGVCEQTLTGHSECVCALAELPDGRLVSGSSDSTIKLWNVRSGLCEQTLTEYSSTVHALVKLSDGRLASRADDYAIELWNVKSGICEQTLTGHSNYINALAALSDGRLASGSNDDTIKLWNVRSGLCEQMLTGHSRGVSALAELSDGRLASGSWDHTIKLWNVRSGLCEQTLTGHSESVYALAALSDGRLASGSRDDTIKLWNVRSGLCEQTLTGHSNVVYALSELSDGRLASGSGDKTIKLWSVLPSLGRALSLDEVSSLLVLLKSNRSVTQLNLEGIALEDTLIPLLIELVLTNTTLTHLNLQKTRITLEGLRKLYETIKSRKPLLQLEHEMFSKLQEEEKEKLEINPTLETVQEHIRGNTLTTLVVSQVRVREAKGDEKVDTKAVGEWKGHSDAVSAVAVLPDGRLASGSTDKTIKLWNVASGACEWTLKGHGKSVTCLTVLPDGRLVSGSSDKTIKLWNVASGVCEKTLTGHRMSVTCLTVLSDGRLASGSSDNTIKLWNMRSGKCEQTLTGHGERVICLTVLDGRLVSGSCDKTIKLWNVGSGVCEQTLRRHSDWVSALTVLPDGQLASGSDDKTIKLWKVGSEETLTGHSDSVWALAALLDGRLVSGSVDKTIKLWSVGSGACEETLAGHSDAVNALTVLPDGRLVSGSDDNTIKLWNVSPALGRALSLEEVSSLLVLLKSNRSVTQLSVEGIALEDKHIPLLSELVLTNTTLIHLNLQKTKITIEGIKKLYEAMRGRLPLLQLQHEFISRIQEEEQTEALRRAQEEAEKRRQGEEAERLRQAEQETLKKAQREAEEKARQVQEVEQLRQALEASRLAQQQTEEARQKAEAEAKAKAAEAQAAKSLLAATPSPQPLPASGKGSGVPLLSTVPRIAWNELKVGSLIGNGSYGDVYQGQWHGVDVAIKQLQLKTLPQALSKEFEREADMMMQCSFPSIVRLYGVCTEAGHYAMVMEHMSGGSLRQRLQEDKPLPWSKRFQIALDMTQGLAYLHSRNILHRDLKSLNILLDNHDHAKLSDFGLAKVKLEVSSTSTKTHTSGTVRWRAPELFKRHATSTPASDIYSLGMILWELASRQLPYADAADDVTVMGWIKDGEQEKIPDDCPKAFADIIQSCWSSPDKRPRAEQIVVALKEAQMVFEQEEKVRHEQEAKAKELTEQKAKEASLKPWHFDPSIKPPPEAIKSGYVLISAGPQDTKKVVEAYNQGPVSGYEIRSVQVIYNPQLNRAFAGKFELLEERSNSPAFNPKWPQEEKDVQKNTFRRSVVQRLETISAPYQDKAYPHVKCLPLWHGTKPDILPSLFKTGFAALTTTDVGFFGKGLYSAYEADYSYRSYYEGALLLNWVIFYSAYPVVEGDMPKLTGKPAYQNYDAHFIPVVPDDPKDPTTKAYYPCKPNEVAKYHELVVFDTAQCLPRYLVELQPSLPKAPSSLLGLGMSVAQVSSHFMMASPSSAAAQPKAVSSAAEKPKIS